VPKKGLGIDVYQAARERIRRVFDCFPNVYVSFSGGKDSGVMLHMVADEAESRGRRFGVLFVDLEAQYSMTIDYITECVSMYKHIDMFWVCLPISLRNAVSQFNPKWICWDEAARAMWVRQPPSSAITDGGYFNFFRHGMEFEEFVPKFGSWYGGGGLTACLVGIRSDESLNRYRTIAAKKQKFEDWSWSTYVNSATFNCYPIYDWKTEDIWRYNAISGKPYNKLYDRMHQAGLTIHQARICQPYGDDQRKGLWLYHVIEPETWGRVLARVNGANQGALYARESGNVLGRLKITKPAGHTWESFARLILSSQPPSTREHYENKIAVFLKWYACRGYSNGIPDDGELDKKKPSWKRTSAKRLLV